VSKHIRIVVVAITIIVICILSAAVGVKVTGETYGSESKCVIQGRSGWMVVNVTDRTTTATITITIPTTSLADQNDSTTSHSQLTNTSSTNTSLPGGSINATSDQSPGSRPRDTRSTGVVINAGCYTVSTGTDTLRVTYVTRSLFVCP